MILKGSQRGGAMQLAKHLLNDRDNDHVEIHAINGFIADDIEGALTEIYAISRATKCTQFMFSLSLSPPQNAVITTQDYENAIEQAANKLGLAEQPHVMLFHEKNGRRHCHVVFSRINTDHMKAINLPFFKERLNELAHELYLTYGWELPKGMQDRSLSDPLNYSLEEYQLAKRAGRDPREIKATLIQCWQQSDSKMSFIAALQEKGFYLCRGTRRGFVALDWQGNVYSLSRWLDEKTRSLKARLDEPEQLLSIEKMQHSINLTMTKKHREFQDEIREDFTRKQAPLNRRRDRIVKRQRREREKLLADQKNQRQREAFERSKRLRKGLFGLWDWISGNRRKTVKRNSAEIESNKRRDQHKLLRLIQQHQAASQNVQAKIRHLKHHRETVLADLKVEFQRREIQNNNHRLGQSQERDQRENDIEPTLH